LQSKKLRCHPSKEDLLVYTLLVLSALAQPAPEGAAPGSAPPEQVLATIDAKGKLTLTHLTCACYGPAVHEQTVTGKDKVPVKVKVSSVVLTTAELPAKSVEAYSVDGKAISAETLATLLAKERTVLVSMDGKKLDPFYLQLYKEGTIVLVPPANTLNIGGAVGPYGYGSTVLPIPAPPPPGFEKVPQAIPEKILPPIPDKRPN
jgi:hypothetical protein